MDTPYELGQIAALSKLGMALMPRPVQALALPERAVKAKNALQIAAARQAAKKALRSSDDLSALIGSRPKVPLDAINPAARRT